MQEYFNKILRFESNIRNNSLKFLSGTIRHNIVDKQDKFLRY